MKNNIVDVYKKFGDKFCICPFLGGFYQSHRVVNKNQSQAISTITPCSVTSWTHDHEFDMVDNSIEKTINKPVWQMMRRAFAKGEYQSIPQCKTCHDAERAGAHVPRHGANLHFSTNCHEADLLAEIQAVIDNDFYTNKLLSLDWFPSNYCNFSCVMCAGGASSTRLTYEMSIHQIRQHIVQNELAHDFHRIVDGVEVLNFTGGETVMQTQVVDAIKQMAQQPNAGNKTIFLLTNASTYPDALMPAFAKFHKVIYMCSIDGVGAVGEYQRRNSDWIKVESNSLRLLKHEFIATVTNFVLTSINVLDFMTYVDWLYQNQIVNGVTISQVFRQEHLGMTALPPDLRELALARLNQGLIKYSTADNMPGQRCREIISKAKSIIETSEFSAVDHDKFVAQIKQEDKASARPFVEIVPEWQPYFA